MIGITYHIVFQVTGLLSSQLVYQLRSLQTPSPSRELNVVKGKAYDSHTFLFRIFLVLEYTMNKLIQIIYNEFRIMSSFSFI
jgi:hypothetical protein